ncbi:MAG: OmpA family protein [Saprospiraceae bacterium]|nr:OmpA family protein [Saprospiraceae bacterium]MCF8251436.1 OmpA family protein [Saprospiraceae bacterium]MCF8282564.1 OmpA family protein [Bacteroidales bacterium]MCF8313031.1 OmpA family protein [Saprospiraceae bacterium]MCF8441478.1 OmpA family protein [Saprospiraceae bacterium]
MKPILSLFLQLAIFGCLAAQSGLKTEYYNGTDFNEMVATRIEPMIDLSWNDEPPVPGLNPHDCSIRWTGILNAPETGTYTFSAKVDDGIRVWVGGILVIDNWKLNDNGHFTGRVIMREGTPYDLKVEYFNALIEGEVRLLWKLPEAERPIIVESKFFTQTIPPPPPKPVEAKKSALPVKSAPKPDVQKKPSKTDAPAVVPKDTLERYVPKDVLFEQSKSVMLLKSKTGLDLLAGFLLRNPDIKLKIEGHTDIIGDQDMNKALSDERAKVVAEYLAKKGIAQNRIEAKGYGSSLPLITGNSKRGYPENRRVVFILY